MNNNFIMQNYKKIISYNGKYDKYQYISILNYDYYVIKHVYANFRYNSLEVLCTSCIFVL